ncbi:LuxR C-terminal-related transcriptional regulator [Hahella sp. SMD15-11]|uniref:LuxR C-terminal-related transcriptional regulator n=1 Tax=Thermohahella caldifontis TaxID=3142973 RepID=A0AB39UYS3_9GAMM
MPSPDLDKWLESQPRVCIQGPAGTGKTLLAARHAARLRRQGTTVVWISLAPAWSDRDSIRTLIRTALARALPEADDPFVALTDGTLPLAVFVDQTEHLTQPDAVAELEALCLQLPDSALIWMLGRPPLPASRWLLRFRLRLVGGEQLWWNDEAQSPVWARLTVPLSPTRRQALGHQLGGWIAPLTLYTEALSAGESTATLLVRQYVEEEVLAPWPEPVRHLARRLALLPEWSLEMAAGEDEHLLQALGEAMAYLAPFEVSGSFGRQLHPLLAACLRPHATHEEAGDEAWQQAMAAHYRDHPDPLICCEWFWRNQQWSGLSQKLAETGQTLLRKGYHLQVLGYLESMPEAVRNNAAMLRLRLWSLFYADRRGELARAIQHARIHISTGGLPADELTLLEMMTRPPKELGTGPDALETLARLRKQTVPVRSVAYLGLASAYYWQGELGEAETLALEALTHAKLEQRFSTVLSASGLALWLMSIRGEVIRARNLLRDSTLWLENFHESGQAPNLVSCWRNSARIRLAVLQGDLESGWKALQPMKLFMASAEPAHQTMTLYSEAFWLLHAGQPAEALDRLDQAERIIRSEGERFSIPAPPVDALRIRCLLMLGRLRDAGELIQSGTGGRGAMHPFDTMEWQEAECLWALFDGQRQQAEERAQALATRAKAERFLAHHLTAKLVQACLTGETGKRRATFERCVEIAASNDLVFPLLHFRPFFTQDLETLQDVPLIGEFVERITHLNVKQTSESDTPLPSGDHEALSRRELQVLELIAEGLSNKEIAVRLHLAPATVKAHIRNIYSKIGARSRADALRLADALNLL